MDKVFEIVSKKLNFSMEQITKTMELLDEGATIPFISRYRKEVTGNLDEVAIESIQNEINYLRGLNKRKEEVLRLIEEQGKLNEELRVKISNAVKLQEVEDIYFPYRKKRKTKADIAKEKGLEPLSILFMSAKNIEELENKSSDFLNDDVLTKEEALEGAKLILAEKISEIPEYREKIREDMLKLAVLTCKETKKAKELDEKKVYIDYYAYSEPIIKMPSHRILAINRGDNEDILNISISFAEEKLALIEGRILINFFGKENNLLEEKKEIIKDALTRLIFPSIDREVRNILTEKAEIEAIGSFKLNLKNLLMQSPLKNMAVMALDPGYRTGCKVALIDKNGFYKHYDVFFLVEAMHAPNQLATAKKKMIDYILKYEIDIIAIGNGTASRETESFVAKILKEVKRDVKYLIVNEAGASIYSASKIAAEEFPDLDVTVRGAISIGRRIQDPMAELVKIDPKSIGIGMYQHDVNQKKIEESLNNVIEGVVNTVGASLNSASWALLSHVSGIKKNIAKNIVDYRQENGNFKNRKELLKVKGLGSKAYEQMAGFLVIQDGEKALDGTIIHPESYHIAEEILLSSGSSLKEYEKDREISRKKIEKIKLEEFIKEKGYGEETTKDIYGALLRDRRDPRENFDKPLLKSDILKINDLKIGMEIEGTVRNVIAFGAFIDIGLKNDALLHISEISDTFVSDPNKVLSVGQIIKVKIKDINLERQRVGLTRKGS
ncbi:MAG: Tex family protein [Fusobacteriaceae bacterium]